ncbi:MAG: hypothetical protein ACRC92_20125 [Peptostreptococcaceae bacterium]
MSIAYASKFNSVAARLRVARDKYYPGYGVTGDVGGGGLMRATDTNNLMAQCTQVSAKSPLVYSFGSVSAGQLISEAIFNTAYTQINAVANCYSNCHTNCHSNCNCYSDCNCDSKGRCPD